MSEDLHIYHCQLCFTPSKCQLLLKDQETSSSYQYSGECAQATGAESSPPTCPIVPCANSRCPFRMHKCKLEDHLTICSYSLVPCINSEYGCRKVLPYLQTGPHLEHCEASLVMCSGKFARKLASEIELKNGNYRKFFEQLLNDQSALLETEDPDVHSGLFIEHWKTLLKSEFTERAFDVNSDHFLVPVDIGHSHSVDDKANDSDTEKNLQLLSDDEPEMGAQPGVSDAGVGKCVTCTKLGILCMYDIERVNKKPFWIEARKHFRNISKSLTPAATAFNDETNGGNGSKQSLKLLKLELLNGSGFWSEKSPYADVDFPCRVVRRDEYSTHWYLHHDLLFQFEPNLCPNRFCSYQNEVCTYSCSLIDNSEYKMKFQSETNAVTISPQMFKIDLSQNGIRTDLAEQQELSLLSLPIEVLFGIFHYLDSLSLSCLSRVSKQIRWLVLDYCDDFERAMAIRDWTKSSKKDRVQSGMREWNPLAAHYTFSHECFLPQSVAQQSTKLRETRASSSQLTLYESQIYYVNPQLSTIFKTNHNAPTSLINHLSQCPCYERKSIDEILDNKLNHLLGLSELSKRIGLNTP